MISRWLVGYGGPKASRFEYWQRRMPILFQGALKRNFEAIYAGPISEYFSPIAHA